MNVKIIKIEKSPVKFKKYRADALIDGEVYKNVDFGDTRYVGNTTDKTY